MYDVCYMTFGIRDPGTGNIRRVITRNPLHLFLLMLYIILIINNNAIGIDGGKIGGLLLSAALRATACACTYRARAEG
jgi:hypothetical protein